MNGLYKRYVELMLRTRGLSIAAASGLLFLSAAEIAGVVQAWINHETSVSFENNLGDLILLGSVGILILALGFRIYILSRRDEQKHFRQVASWIAVVVPLIAFFVVWDISTRPMPSVPCDHKAEEMCFGIYVFYRSPPLLIAMQIFIGGSILRSLVTLMVAKANLRKKLK